MDQKQIYAYLKTRYSPDEAREALYRAATIAHDLNWPFMETSFQLGEKAKEDGLDKDTIESTLRRAYARERRTRDRERRSDSAPLENGSPSISTGESANYSDDDAESLLQRRRIDPDALSIPWPSEDWRKDLLKLLEACFKPEDSFDFKVADTPNLHREMVSVIQSQQDSLNKIMRSLDGQSGALMSINATLQEGAHDDSWKYRYAVVESPRLELAKQLAFLKALNLPCAAVVATGSNSLQAWVRIEASDANEFTDRVDFLFNTLEDNGFKVDIACKSPTQMVRMPGVLRAGKQQYLLGLNQGAHTWKEWQDWVEYCLDGNPLVELASNHEQAPTQDSELVEGILRPGQFLLLTAPPRAGKSLALVDLSLALCHGADWIGIPTNHCDVLFVNMELNRTAFLNRLHTVAKEQGLAGDTSHLGLLNLRGTNWNPAELAAFIAKRVRGARKYEGRNYQVVVIDPITAIIAGAPATSGSDARSAMLQQAVDAIVASSGAAVIGALPSSELSSIRLAPDGQLDFSPIGDRMGMFQVTGSFREFPSLIARECSWRYPVFSA